MRDEKNVIARCLRSAQKTLGDQFAGVVLADTGSQDQTIAIARGAFPDAVIVEHEWHDFATNRNLLLDVAYKQGSDYLLMLDPDMTVEGELPSGLSEDGYEINILGVGEIAFRNPRLLSTRRRWRYEGVVHEALAEYPGLPKLDSMWIRHHGTADHREDGRFERDRAMLQNTLPSRSLFYLAQTERDLGNGERAAQLYELRASLGGWGEEVYYALYQAGLLRQSVEGLLSAWESRPSRGEALYYLIGLLRGRNAYNTAHALSTIGLQVGLPDDVLFVEPWIHHWGLQFEHSVTSFWIGDYRTSVKLCEELLERDDLFDQFREQTVANMGFAREKLC
jgi:glycosyltransferase involved in cell wall biosynthesis